MNEESIFKARLDDLANKSYKQNIYTYTSFLSPAEYSIFLANKDLYKYAGYSVFDMDGNVERRMIRFGSVDNLGYDEPWPISIIQIAPYVEKFSDKLNHRDYLGAIMNLGIERSTMGDILVKDNLKAYVYCQDNMSKYIIDNLNKVKHTNIRCSLIALEKIDNIEDLKPNLMDIEVVVASTRFDVIVAAVTKASRSETHNFFKAGKVTKDGMIFENNSYVLKGGEIFSIRGYGKFVFVGCGNVTRKGRMYVSLKKYN